MAKRPGINRRDLARARAESTVRFGSERATLAALMDQLSGQYETDVNTARGTAATLARGARRSRPKLRRIYNQAQRGVQVAQQDVESNFNQAGLTPDNSFRLVADTEAGAFRSKLASESAAAQREAVRAEREAKLGKVFAVSQAKDRYRADLGKLQDRLRQLGDEEGAFIVSRLGEIGDKRTSGNTQLAVAKQYGRNERASSQAQKEIAEIYAHGKDGGGKPASRSELRSFKSNYAQAMQVGRKYANSDVGRRRAARDLTLGVPGSKTKSGRSVPTIEDQLAIGVALDMAYQGHVSRRNAELLRKSGIRLADLPGAKSYRQWRRENRPSGTPIVGDILGAAGLP